MKKCRAIFHCSHVIQAVEGYPSKAYLFPVCDEKEEYKSYSDATPSGALEICISEGVPAENFFKQGRDYQLDFTRLPKEEM